LPRPAFHQARRRLTAAQAASASHAGMEHIDLNRADTAQGVRQELERLTAGGWLSPEQTKAVNPSHVVQFWASPLGREAAASPQLRREFKFSILAPAGRFYPTAGEGEEVLLQGVVDCCFTGPEGFTVVDFKS
ncbi:MAG: helicase-exonuclease AddAB subunit AddA, partial [Clostridiales bacterium]|nr:helicase-exonuclease AddAB subunit AddA [Clostridiales bacterium]